MDFSLTPKQQEVYDLVEELGRHQFASAAAQHDRDATLPLDNLAVLARHGLLGLTVGRDLGGHDSGVMGSDPLLYLLAIEQTARFCLATAQCLHIHCHGAHLIDRISEKSQRKRVLEPVVGDGALLNVTGSEPGQTARGFFNYSTVAARTQTGYVLNGKKAYATLASGVSYNIVFAGVDGMSPPDSHIGFLVPPGAAGLFIDKKSWDPMGMRGAASPNMLLTDCFVADENVIAPPGSIPRQRWQAKFQLSFAAQYVGAAQGIFDFLLRYLPKRGTTGDSYTQLRLGEIAIGIEAARCMMHRAAWLWQAKRTTEAEVYTIGAKRQAIESASVAMDKAARIAGPSAFTAAGEFSRMFRDLRVQTLHENPDKASGTVGRAHLGLEYDTTAR
ncbi:MAG: acyl-CoA dehydrogenase family protein [Reyranellaceae bacterium]